MNTISGRLLHYDTATGDLATFLTGYGFPLDKVILFAFPVGPVFFLTETAGQYRVESTTVSVQSYAPPYNIDFPVMAEALVIYDQGFETVKGQLQPVGGTFRCRPLFHERKIKRYLKLKRVLA